MNANENHAELGYRTLLVHAQYVGMKFNADNMDEVIVDLLTSLMHLNKDYHYNFDDMLRMAKDRFNDNANMKYRQCGSEIYCGKTCVAKIMFRDGETELRILQGMPRDETVKRIKAETPVYFREFGIPDNVYPKLFAQGKQTGTANNPAPAMPVMAI